MRFFKLHEDEIFVIGDPTRHIVLILSRSKFDTAGQDIPTVELESSSMLDFRRHLCTGCEKDGSNMMDLRSRIAPPCRNCPKEVKPR